MKKESKQLNILFAFLGVLALLVAWMVLSLSIGQDVILPSIPQTLKRLYIILTTANSYKVLGLTMLRLLIGLAVSLALAIILASLSMAFNKFSYFIRPLITFLRTVPVVAIIIILLVYVGNQNASLYITMLVTLPLMYEGIYGGLKQINKDILDEIKIMTSVNFTVITKIFIPIVYPNILVAIISSLGLGIKVLVMSEFIATPKYSIAKEMFNYQSSLQMDGIFAWTIILVVLVMVTEVIIKRLIKIYDK